MRICLIVTLYQAGLLAHPFQILLNKINLISIKELCKRTHTYLWIKKGNYFINLMCWFLISYIYIHIATKLFDNLFNWINWIKLNKINQIFDNLACNWTSNSRENIGFHFTHFGYIWSLISKPLRFFNLHWKLALLCILRPYC